MVGKSVRGIGLSDQAWLCDTDVACPLPVIQNWAERAIKAGAMAIQFEPANYFFELAKGANRVGYPNSSQWREVSGRPSEQLVLLASALGVDFTRREPTPLSRIQNDRTICMALDIDQHSVVEGQTFKASATFRNAGRNTWEPNGVSLFSYSDDVWSIGSVSLPEARVEPGHNVKVSFTSTAPSKPGRQRLDVGLRSKDGARFEDFCSISVSVESKK
jgi:Ig-like domain from next to BRCA1 gene